MGEKKVDAAEQASQKAREHAFEFLLPADPRASIQMIGERLLVAADNDPSIAAKFRAIRDMISGTVLVKENHYAMYQRLRSAYKLDVPTAPEWLRPLLVVAYLRAKSVVASGRLRNLIPNLPSTLDEVAQLAETLEPDFLGELLVETSLAAWRDARFARKLEEGAEEFRSLVDYVYGSRDADRPDDNAPKDRPRAMARAATGVSGAGDCTCCANGNCEPCSCWIIVIIIIIIIVTK